MKDSDLDCGFTLPEVVIVVAVTGILAGVVAVNLSQSQHRTDIHAAVNVLATDIRQQQIKSMVGDTQGTGAVMPYGVYFQSDRYTLFRGLSYSPSDTANFTITLDPSLRFANDTFPGMTVLFLSGSGEFSGFSSNANTIQLKDTVTNQTETITLNRYGVITNIN